MATFLVFVKTYFAKLSIHLSSYKISNYLLLVLLISVTITKNYYVSVSINCKTDSSPFSVEYSQDFSIGVGVINDDRSIGDDFIRTEGCDCV